MFYKHIEWLFTEEHLSARLMKLMLQEVNVCDKLFVHDVEHASAMAVQFVNVYLTTQLHHWCKQLNTKQHEGDHAVCAGGQARCSNQTKLQRLNVNLQQPAIAVPTEAAVVAPKKRKV